MPSKDVSSQSLNAYKRDLQQYPRTVSPKDVVKIAKQYRKTRCVEFRDQLVFSAAPWVIHLAWRYANAYGVPELLNDLIQEGNIGLLRAALKYDHRRGCTFTTYATNWIRAMILDFILIGGQMLYRPRNIRVKCAKLRKMVALLKERLGELPTDKQILSAGISAKDLKVLSLANPETLSLDEVVHSRPYGSTDVTLGDTIPDPISTKAMAYGAESADLQSKIAEFVSRRFSEQDAGILKMRFGFLEWDGEHTFPEIANHFGGSPGYAQQRLSRVLRDRNFRQFIDHTLFTVHTPHVPSSLAAAG